MHAFYVFGDFNLQYISPHILKLLLSKKSDQFDNKLQKAFLTLNKLIALLKKNTLHFVTQRHHWCNFHSVLIIGTMQSIVLVVTTYPVQRESGAGLGNGAQRLRKSRDEGVYLFGVLRGYVVREPKVLGLQCPVQNMD